MVLLATSTPIRDSSLVVFRDNTTAMNIFDSPYRFYAWTGLLNRALGDSTHFGINESELPVYLAGGYSAYFGDVALDYGARDFVPQRPTCWSTLPRSNHHRGSAMVLADSLSNLGSCPSAAQPAIELHFSWRLLVAGGRRSVLEIRRPNAHTQDVVQPRTQVEGRTAPATPRSQPFSSDTDPSFAVLTKPTAETNMRTAMAGIDPQVQFPDKPGAPESTYSSPITAYWSTATSIVIHASDVAIEYRCLRDIAAKASAGPAMDNAMDMGMFTEKACQTSKGAHTGRSWRKAPFRRRTPADTDSPGPRC